jgi:hypothetical protein
VAPKRPACAKAKIFAAIRRAHARNTPLKDFSHNRISGIDATGFQNRQYRAVISERWCTVASHDGNQHHPGQRLGSALRAENDRRNAKKTKPSNARVGRPPSLSRIPIPLGISRSITGVPIDKCHALQHETILIILSVQPNLGKTS